MGEPCTSAPASGMVWRNTDPDNYQNDRKPKRPLKISREAEREFHLVSEFALCFIPDTGFASMLEIFEAIRGWKSVAQKIMIKRPTLSHIFADPKAVRAVAIREPLERFTCSLLSSRFAGHEKEKCPLSAAYQSMQPRFRDIVEWAIQS